MKPEAHFVYGLVFTLIFWAILPDTPWYFIISIFLASFLIDLDHYITGAIKLRTGSLRKVRKYYDDMDKDVIKEKAKGIYNKGDFHLFHTIEFHLIIGVIGFFYLPFFYIFIGMIFHSMLDLISILYRGVLFRREYFFFSWLRKKWR